ncbi:hypothetical protein [Longimicrobium sp.]|jgi:hypothetical protein|uniref:hypothetical protein n=1 Tax=Longimicrobium sp. TaxID=2029185 RepID=UPI002EDB01E9
MNLPFRTTFALALLLLAAVPAPAQDADAWVLPRGKLEVTGTGVFTHYQRRLGGDGLGSEFAQPFQDLALQALGDSLARANVGTRQLWSRLTGGSPLPDSLDPGTTSLRLRADVRQVPLTVRYGWRDRITVFATLPIERRAVSSLGPFLLGGNVGLNPDAVKNRAALANIDSALAGYGGGLLLPTRGSQLGDSLQALLRKRGTDTLNLPTATVDFANLQANQQLAAFDSLSNSRGYRFGDVQVGARFLLTPGPPGWPIPDTVQRRAVRTSVGVRGRLPTGARGTMFRTELVPGGGHFGLGVDAFNDLFLSRRWLVSASASFDVLLPADVQRLAFAADRPFPPDTAVRTVRREPGSQLAFNVVPRWRLTRELSFAGQYAFTRAGATTYTGDVLPSPVETLDAWMAHAAGIGARYSTLRAYSLGQAAVPVEVDLSVLSAFAGSGEAPAYSQVRIIGRFHPHRGLLPGPDSIPPPPPVPADTTAPAPVATTPATEPATPPTPPPGTPPATPLPIPPTGSNARPPAQERR